MENFFYGEIDENLIKNNILESALRLKIPKNYQTQSILECEKILRSKISAKYVGVIVDITFPSENVINLGYGNIFSKDLYKNLKGCKKAFVFCVTLGIQVDRLLSKLSTKSVTEHFITDALSSSLCESLCDLVDNKISNGFVCRNRFSVGYGDLSILEQKNVISLTNADKYLNVKLTDNYLMIPTKTITAIKGIE